jgi:hypothetical protein
MNVEWSRTMLECTVEQDMLEYTVEQEDIRMYSRAGGC